MTLKDVVFNTQDSWMLNLMQKNKYRIIVFVKRDMNELFCTEAKIILLI